MGQLTDPQESQNLPRISPVAKVLGAIALLVGIVIFILVTGGQDAVMEAAGDLTYLEGRVRPMDSQEQMAAAAADILDAEISRTGTGLTLIAQVAADVPQPLRVSSLEFRWELTAEDGTSWTVTTVIEKTTETSVYSSTGFGASTVDDTLLGGAQILGDTLEVRFDFRDMPNFPEAFEWSLSTTLRPLRAEPNSARVEDRFPDDGLEHLS